MQLYAVDLEITELWLLLIFRVAPLVENIKKVGFAPMGIAILVYFLLFGSIHNVWTGTIQWFGE